MPLIRHGKVLSLYSAGSRRSRVVPCVLLLALLFGLPAQVEGSSDLSTQALGSSSLAEDSSSLADDSSDLRALKIAQGQPGPSVGPSQPAVIAQLRRGTQMIDAGKLPEALSIFQDYTRSRPEDPTGYFWIGVCFDEMSNFKNAVIAYQEAISRAEQKAMDSCEIRMNLGNALLKDNDIDQAIEAYKRALEVNPSYGLALLNLGRAYIAKANYPAALSAFDKCEELHFNPRQVPYYRAKALLALGRKDEACALVQRLLLDTPPGASRTDLEREFQSCLPLDK